MLANCVINIVLVNSKDLTAGLFSGEDFYIFATLANKFYTKIGASAFGVMCAVFYLDILAYRRVPTEEEK